MTTFNDFPSLKIPRSYGVPDGVTVRKAGEEPRPRPSIKSVIELAGECDDRNYVITILTNALDIFDRRLGEYMLSAQYKWARISSGSRLMEIGEWLRAECFESMDLVKVPNPLATVGTND